MVVPANILSLVGKYLSTRINNNEPHQNVKKVIVWGEEGKKLFIFQRSGYLNSSLALDAEKKLYV